MASPFSAALVRGTDDGRTVLGTRPLRELIEAIAPQLRDDEARELVAAWFDQPRHWPTLNADQRVSEADWDAVLASAEKRAKGAPLQYAVGKANFRNLTLAVDDRVLIPRPETELLVDLVLQRAPRGGVAVDVGTGSGAIAIALATEGTFDRVIATDISLDALDVARNNAMRCRATIDVVQSDLLGFAGREPSTVRRSSLAGHERRRVPIAHGRRREPQFAAVVSNPPYITFDEAAQLPRSVRDWEPALALFSARDGLAHTARLVAQAASMLQDEGLLALEVDARRASLVADLVARDERYAQVSVELDLTGRERFVHAVRRRRSTHD